MLTILRAIAATAVLLTAAPMIQMAAAQDLRRDMKWSRFDLPANGVSLRVPLGVFEAMPTDAKAQGRLFVSHDGKAQLLVGAFENVDGRAPSEHQKFVIAENYATAKIDYAPLRRNWFVLSGTLGERTFYQRVTFSCGGRLISSWAMLYPTTQKNFYDGLVERMHRSFEAGRGPGGDCRLEAATN